MVPPLLEVDGAAGLTPGSEFDLSFMPAEFCDDACMCRYEATSQRRRAIRAPVMMLARSKRTWRPVLPADDGLAANSPGEPKLPLRTFRAFEPTAPIFASDLGWPRVAQHC